MEEHCQHWQEGDGDCCYCHEPNWCPDEGETAEALDQFQRRQWSCPSRLVDYPNVSI